jgi:hypothetical protein
MLSLGILSGCKYWQFPTSSAAAVGGSLCSKERAIERERETTRKGKKVKNYWVSKSSVTPCSLVDVIATTVRTSGANNK